MYISMGLWPLPERTPLNAHIFGKIERDGYSVEKVYFESYPGFYVFANLYCPLGKKGPFPIVMNPHGHWAKGRITDSNEGSIPARCISFARQGYMAITYSMAGYNESAMQLKHEEEPNTLDNEEMWGMNELSLNIWNGMRAIDLMTSLPDADPNRIAITGASGGGSQTLVMAAMDDRITVSAPVCMMAFIYQGGGACQNSPGLRISASNVEFSAMAAPRPQLIVSATGDWTKTTPELEFPAVRKIYKLFDAEDRVANAHINAGHNYNKDSREAVYAWFAKWLQPGKEVNTKEMPYTVEKDADLLTMDKLPEGALTRAELLAYLKKEAIKAINDRMPKNWQELIKFREIFGYAYKDIIGAYVPAKDDLLMWKADDTTNASKLFVGRKEIGDRIPAVLFYPADKKTTSAVLVADGNGLAHQVDGVKPRAGSLTAELLAKGNAVLVMYPFPASEKVTIKDEIYTQRLNRYNRMPAAEAVQDILTGVGLLHHNLGFDRVRIVGLGDSGLTVLLSVGLSEYIESAAVDINGFDNTSDAEFVKKMNIPPLRRAGDLTTAAALAVPKKLVLFNAGDKFQIDNIAAIYKAVKAGEMLSISKELLSSQVIAGKIVLNGCE